MRRRLIKLFLTILLTLVMVSPSFGSVSLYLVDDVSGLSPGEMTVETTTTAEISGVGTLQYSLTGGNDFQNWGDNPIIFNFTDYQQIFFQLVVTDGNYIIDSGTISFGQIINNINGIEASATALINFDNFSYTFTSTAAEGGDGFASTPIPSIGLLIGTAFSGLFMFRRQVFKG